MSRPAPLNMPGTLPARLTGGADADPPFLVLEQAADWFARLRDGRADPSEQAAWQVWHDAAEAHGTAWRRVQEISRVFESAHGLPDRRATADELCTANARLGRRRRVLSGLVVLAAGGSLAWSTRRETGLGAWVQTWSADHRTGIGEQRALTLEDGTHLWLNTRSGVQVAFDASVRRLNLLAGEIFIVTGRDPARPFVVDTPQGRLRALGTRFNVRMDDDTTGVSVYEGAVEVQTGRGGVGGVGGLVRAGSQVRFLVDRLGAGRPADSSRESWTRGTLSADNLPLHKVIGELRRYRRGRLDLDESVADLKVFGNFPIRETDRVLGMLASELPIRVERVLPGWTRVAAAR